AAAARSEGVPTYPPLRSTRTMPTALRGNDDSGSIPRPAPDPSMDFDEVIDTVVQEDSRVFGVPDVNSSANGSAIPPLPDQVAAQVLTGSNPRPPIDDDESPLGDPVGATRLGRPPTSRSTSSGTGKGVAANAAPVAVGPGGFPLTPTTFPHPG